MTEKPALAEKPQPSQAIEVDPQTQLNDLHESISTLESKIATLDAEISNACENEDFDAADRL